MGQQGNSEGHPQQQALSQQCSLGLFLLKLDVSLKYTEPIIRPMITNQLFKSMTLASRKSPHSHCISKTKNQLASFHLWTTTLETRHSLCLGEAEIEFMLSKPDLNGHRFRLRSKLSRFNTFFFWEDTRENSNQQLLAATVK